ncbi:MAG: D-aminoacyl-tRNA deacylase [Sulfolobales archaeon]|nr:hypothetical protein [Sulfolobales archaeon]MCX8208095.1 hypothetical protein [Sulfolobales archaeon]MDW8010085.1 D-aminoacyl-tRNA deacylase [Sulfolobales archaeon]
MKKVVVAYSVADLAGVGTVLELSKIAGCREFKAESVGVCSTRLGSLELSIAGFSEDVLRFSFLDELFDADYFIVVSRHSAVSGIKSLTVHHTGNPLDRAEYGGRPRELAISNPPIALSILRYLKQLSSDRRLEGVEVTYEVTHHGPTEVGKPLTFAEIGSSPSEWSYKPYQEVLAEAVFKAVTELPHNCTPSIGVGGGHYAHQFTERAMSVGECFGHIISRHVVKELRDSPEVLEDVLRQAVLKSSTRTARVVLEGKIPAYVKQVVRSVSNAYGLEVIE